MGGCTHLVPELLICTLVTPIRTWTKWREVEEWFVNLVIELSVFVVSIVWCFYNKFATNVEILAELHT
jgi:hypothetical protein